MLRSILPWGFLIATPVAAAEIADQKELSQLIETITETQRKLGGQIEQLQQILGIQSALATVNPVAANPDLPQAVQEATSRGIEHFSKRNFEDAKEAFHAAWELAPDHAFANFNLGLSYSRLGNATLARKLLKTALELDETVAAAQEVKRYLSGLNDNYPVEKKERESDELQAARTELINLKKEMDSYLSSRSIGVPERMAAVAGILAKMDGVCSRHDALVEEYFLEICERYGQFEMYDRAVALLDRYEEVMAGKVYPDGSHKTILELREKQRLQLQELEKYVRSAEDNELAHRLGRDLRELGIFATQINQFVSTLEEGDPDFDSVCRRLKEYRWGDRPQRHVIVVDRFQRLLFSSLPGTLPLDRYQDVAGDKFFKSITLLADKGLGTEPHWTTVNLNVNGSQVPYLLLYAYVPRHEAFIIVRLRDAE